MNKGLIVIDYKENIVVLHEIDKENGEPIYEELELHPAIKNYKHFEVGQKVDFQYAHECTLHYPDFCDCYKKKLFALVVPPKEKGFFDKLKKLFNKNI